ncbi:valyl-tRNA synthase [Candidatus Magnetobacterium bavaricum]|uniref:Valine--tRNA ligase n=1 Tax=Candidatus Magnetobacterium bavaricum TaxID=29290 RepID=A0A0F3GT20_9BACT|nr:valyl-tRNA synthase [Candidatus Magnetobacterium bavaricum]
MDEQIKSKAYDPRAIEEKWYDFWLKNNCFSPCGEPAKEAFSIVIPPPNVTGSLHMGHALNATLQDVLARYRRMKGYRVLWLPGTDHAGIATQNVVEKQLAVENLNRHTLGREAFIERVWTWKQQYGGVIIHQLKKLGASCDWSRERFTLDEGLSRAVREVFVRLLEEGLIYRSLRLINWCPRCATALSDLEVEHEDMQGKLTYMRYPFEDNSGYLVVATTRAETMLGDTAVAINPKDGRYVGHIGKMIKLPLTGRLIPIIADQQVDPSFGTGAVKVTPSHDFNDEAIARRQTPILPFISVIGQDGRMTPNVGQRYSGLDRYECRKLVVADLKEKNLIEKEESHNHSIGHCYRCKTIIEPLSTVQWYVNVDTLAGEAIEVVKSSQVRIIPDGWKNSYFSWMQDIRHWCISRQIWWGHQIPAWYCPDCKDENGAPQSEHIHVALNQRVNGLREGSYRELSTAGLTHKEILENAKDIRVGIAVRAITGLIDPTECPDCGSKNIVRDPDVLDTWFSSALWPLSTLGWPDDTDDLKTFYPTSVLVTGFDILFFWVARMIMMGMKFMKDVPFRDVYIHALVRDEKGQKMSKSKGNVIDPLVMIDKYGADAFRFSLAAFAAQGRDIRFSEERVEGYRYFINKLYNASRYININIDKYNNGNLDTIETINEEFERIDKGSLNLPERWILSRLANAANQTAKGLDEYRFNDASSAIYQFIWHELCDWYIELSKTSLAQGSTSSSDPALRSLVYVFGHALRLLHPFMPFITEELWSMYSHSGKSISMTTYPEGLSTDPEAEERMQYIIDCISGVRSIRGELNISPSKPLTAMIRTSSRAARSNLANNYDYIKNLARLETLEISDVVEKPKGAAVSVKTDMEIYIPLSGLFNVKTELERLDKELKKTDDSLMQTNKKLRNEDFISNAPKAVVEKEKERYDELVSKRDKITANIKNMKELEG